MKFTLGSKSTKIIADILMAIILALSFVRWDGNPTFHFVLGIGCTLFFYYTHLLFKLYLIQVGSSGAEHRYLLLGSGNFADIQLGV